MCCCTTMSGYRKYGIKVGWSAGTMADFEVWSVFWILCVMCVAPVKIHCQLVKVYGVCVIPWKQAGTVHGFQQWQDRCWQVVTWTPRMSTTDDVWRTDTYSCWRCQRARYSLGGAQNCLDYREVCVHTGCQRIPKLMTQLIVWAFLVSIGHVSLIKREQFWIWNMVNYTKSETRKRVCDREIIIYLQQRKWKHCHL